MIGQDESSDASLPPRQISNGFAQLVEHIYFRLDLALLDIFLKIWPNRFGLWAKRGRDLHGLARYADAIECYDRALNLDPTFAWAWNGKGSVLKDLGRLEEALDCLSAGAISTSPTRYGIGITSSKSCGY